jgi:hypothetical protein
VAPEIFLHVVVVEQRIVHVEQEYDVMRRIHISLHNRARTRGFVQETARDRGLFP